MKAYMANTFTSIFPFGIIAKGEILEEKHLDALGAATVDDMVARKALKVVEVPGDEPDENAGATFAQTENEADAGNDEAAEPDRGEERDSDEDTGDDPDDEEDEAEEIGMDALDEVVGDQPAEAPAEPAEKPESRRKRAAKKDEGGKRK